MLRAFVFIHKIMVVTNTTATMPMMVSSASC